MRKGTVFRFIKTFNNSAVFNMSFDKTLIDSFKHNEQPVLRFYTWENSMTVGVSQDPKMYATRYPEFKNNCAKRMTGGGALFHGHDLSYSLIVPTHYLEGLSVKESYESLCTFLLHFYKSLGLTANYAKDDESIVLSKSEFCQVGYEAYDIIVNGFKMGGNAQKRSKKFIFQHGSIPIHSTNNTTEQGKSLEDLTIKTTYEETVMKLQKSFEETFEVHLNESSLTTEEKHCLNKLLEESNDS